MSKPRLVVVGSGIAGLSVASATSTYFETTVVEAEIQGGYHSSGRSATIFQKNFETDLISRMAIAAESFFLQPPSGYEDVSEQLTRLIVAREYEKDALDEFFDAWRARTPWMKFVDPHELARQFPIIANHYQYAVMDDESLNLDIHTLLEGHRRKLREQGGTVLNNHRLLGVTKRHGIWELRFADDEIIQADVIVNAAGAWADEVAILCGVSPIGLQPKRRTAILVNPGVDCRNWATIYRISSDLYIKPEGPLLMVSPMDEHNSPPTDAQPELIDIATTVQEFEETTKVEVERPVRTWAGLRSFVEDRNPVIGFDNATDDFFWVGAFGGAGILTSPCYSQIAACLLTSNPIPQEWGIDPVEVSVERLRNG